jgi:hypothetical protein
MAQFGWFVAWPISMVCLTAALVGSATAAPPVRVASVEVQVSAEPELIDHEFSQSRAQITWVDSIGNVWLADVDRRSGMFLPADGRGLLVDTGAVPLGSAPFAFNGPEWVMTASGDQIAYTRYLPDKPQIGRNARIVVARQAENGSWVPEQFGPDAPRYIPFGSETRRDDKPSITYVDSQGNHYWRRTDRFTGERAIAVPTNPFVPLRQVRGARALVYPSTVDGVQQVFYYDLKTAQSTQLTFVAEDKIAAWMWRAPEHDDFVISAIVGDGLRIYRRLPGPDGSLSWQPVLDNQAPAGYKLLSPEPFEYAGRSYLFVGMDIGDRGWSAEIWVANIDPAAPVLKRVSDSAPPTLPHATMLRGHLDGQS